MPALWVLSLSLKKSLSWMCLPICPVKLCLLLILKFPFPPQTDLIPRLDVMKTRKTNCFLSIFFFLSFFLSLFRTRKPLCLWFRSLIISKIYHSTHRLTHIFGSMMMTHLIVMERKDMCVWVWIGWERWPKNWASFPLLWLADSVVMCNSRCLHDWTHFH